MNRAMLGFSTAEIDAMYDDIMNFAEDCMISQTKVKRLFIRDAGSSSLSVAIKAQRRYLDFGRGPSSREMRPSSASVSDYFKNKKSGKPRSWLPMI